MGLTRHSFLSASASPAGLSPSQQAPETSEKLTDSTGRVFRDYDAAPEHVIRFYREHHANQTYDFAKARREYYGQLKQGKATAWEMLERLDTIKDDSDPDISLSQMEHAFQVAESMREDDVSEAMIVAGLVHDMGKALILWGEPQWAVVGDTFPTGLRYSESIIQYQALKNNPDSNVEQYQTDYGIYHPGIGLDSVIMTWGHDEYLYQVLESQSRLPEDALFAIRFHSCYPLHKDKDPRYLALMNDQDRELLPAARILNSHDLYSKSDLTSQKTSELKKYYKRLVEQYIPGTLNW